MSGPVLHRIKRLALHGKQRKQRKQRNVLRAIIMGRELTANNNNEYNSRHSLSDITITTITNSHHLTDQHSIPGLSIPGLHSHKAITTITPIREVYMDTKPSDQLHRSDQSDRWAQCLTRQLVLTIAALITMTIAVMSALTITCYTSYCPLKRKLLLFSDKSTQSHTSAYDMQTNHYPTHQTSARSLPALSAPSSKP
ncbi:unnamed protein product [Oppiella nova]|uniref:Uncharacterized protein n=1 Tax=Oppiella nova TaxID=334625 RepID=A0A7R9LK84_9ACAR|nr:unnamed protein product [Oppiella nova]CAG2163802.1 unnamed protein product [Oppiella nova]